MIDPGPVSDALAAAVPAVMRRVAAHMQRRYTCSLEEDERLLAGQAVPEAGAAGEQGGRVLGGQQPGGERLKKSKHEQQQQQQQQQQSGRQPEQPGAFQPLLTSKLRAAVVARVGEKRCLGALSRWWESGGGVSALDEESRQRQLCQIVKDHVVHVWREPRPGMRGVKRGEGEGGSSSDEEESEDGSSSSSSSSGGEEDSSGQDGADGDAMEAEENGARRRQGSMGGGKASAGAAAKGGAAQVAATLSRPNLQQKQHFAFGFDL